MQQRSSSTFCLKFYLSRKRKISPIHFVNFFHGSLNRPSNNPSYPSRYHSEKLAFNIFRSRSIIPDFNFTRNKKNSFHSFPSFFPFNLQQQALLPCLNLTFHFSKYRSLNAFSSWLNIETSNDHINDIFRIKIFPRVFLHDSSGRGKGTREGWVDPRQSSARAIEVTQLHRRGQVVTRRACTRKTVYR